jgi:hypothetical protein
MFALFENAANPLHPHYAHPIKKQKLIGLSGKAGAGKDTIADRLVANHGFVRVAFADKLKLIISDAFDVPLHFFNDRDKKNEPHPNLHQRYLMDKFGGSDGVCEWFDRVAKDLTPGIVGGGALAVFIFLNNEVVSPALSMTPRQAAQMIGTEGFRECFKKDVWVNYAMRQVDNLLKAGMSVVVSDIRFPDEAQAIKNWDFGVSAERNVVGIKRTNAESHAHASEAAIDAIVRTAQIRILNNGTIDELLLKADLIGTNAQSLVNATLLENIIIRKSLVASVMTLVESGDIRGDSTAFIRDISRNPGQIAILSDAQIEWLESIRNEACRNKDRTAIRNRG